MEKNNIIKITYAKFRVVLLKVLFRKAFIMRKAIPVTVLEEKNFSNLRYVLNREVLLTKLPKSGICAEVGVFKGEFAGQILNLMEPRKLHLIDSWIGKRWEKNYPIVKNTFSTEIKEGKIIINRGKSTEILSSFDDNYFDFIYIDTDHSYETTKQELEICQQKVKGNGIIAGHDFCCGYWDSYLKYGVEEAVYEFCVKYDWEIIYLTADISHKSFALRKIKENNVSIK